MNIYDFLIQNNPLHIVLPAVFPHAVSAFLSLSLSLSLSQVVVYKVVPAEVEM